MIQGLELFVFNLFLFSGIFPAISTPQWSLPIAWLQAFYVFFPYSTRYTFLLTQMTKMSILFIYGIYGMYSIYTINGFNNFPDSGVYKKP